MKAVLDACVLFPTAMREVLLGAAGTGAFQPVWSERILEEWARATRRLPEGSEGIARAEIALMRVNWPGSLTDTRSEDIERISLPDPDDRHVLAAAVAADADTLVTNNRIDFPSRTLAAFGVIPRDPDGFLLEFHHNGFDLTGVVATVRERAENASGREQPVRALLKRAGMPRLGKAIALASENRWV